jgi:tryptophanyl-tRNA synthetase
MSIFNDIIAKLDQHGAKYQLHKLPAGIGMSVAEHIKAQGLDFSDGCATLVFMTEKGPIALMRRDDTKVVSKQLKVAVGVKDLRIASPEELLQHTGFEPGLVSPLLLKIPIYIDKLVLEKKSVRVGSDNNEISLEIATADLAKITNAEVISVCEIDPSKSTKSRFLSGITPSSSKGLHLGNYLGAVKPHVEFQAQGECLYFIADYHALNTIHDPAEFRNNVYETYLDYLALGIDPEKTVFYVESQVKEIFELTEILKNCVTMAEMKRMHAYKDKLSDPDADPDAINMGLFNYPILMAADILLFEPDFIPVGEDQAQHVEICRDIAKTFNHRYGNVMKIPELWIKKDVARVPGTDGQRKMGKSLGNDITIFAPEETIKKQIMSIVTDPGRIHKDDPGDPEKNVTFKYLRLMGYDEAKVVEYEQRYRAGTVGDVELKQEFLRFFLEYFADVRRRRAELATDRAAVLELMRAGAARANAIANPIMEKIREAIGAKLY